jgi:guanylate kinase
VAAVTAAVPGAEWLVVTLWCPRSTAAERLVARGSTDIGARLTAWDETVPLPRTVPGTDLKIDTDAVTPDAAARLIDQQRRKSENPDR